MDIRFDGRTAIVTGAGSGIGFACAKLLAESGAKVAMIGRNPEKISAAAKLLDGLDVHPYALDVSRTADIPGVVESIRRELGEVSLLIQAAGLMFGGSALELTDQQWDMVLNTNAKGLFFMMQAVVKQSMLPNGGGEIVNICSMAGIRGMTPPMCSASYSASKGAVAALTMQAATEWGHGGVRVNAIAPGGTMSMGIGAGAKPAESNAGPGKDMPAPVNFVPTGRPFNTVEEIASACVFLCSTFSGNTTGQILTIDGGASIVGY